MVDEISHDSDEPTASVATFYTKKKKFQLLGKFTAGQSLSHISKPTSGKYRIPKSAMSEEERQDALKVMRAFNENRNSSSYSRGPGGRGRGNSTAQTRPRPRLISPKLRRVECPASMPKSLVKFLTCRHWTTMTTKICLPLWTQQNLRFLGLFSHRSGILCSCFLWCLLVGACTETYKSILYCLKKCF